MLLIKQGGERHSTNNKAGGVNLAVAQCQQIKDDGFSAAGRLHSYQIMSIKQAVDGKDLRQNFQ